MTVSHDRPPSGYPLTRRQARQAERSGHFIEAASGSAKQETDAVVSPETRSDDSADYVTTTRPQFPSYGSRAFRDRSIVGKTSAEGNSEDQRDAAVADRAVDAKRSESRVQPVSREAENRNAGQAHLASHRVRDLSPRSQDGAPLTRRQLRAMRQAEVLNSSAAAAVTESADVEADLPGSANERQDIKHSRPAGHWSSHVDGDDEARQPEHMISRSVGTGAITTNALVLPSNPTNDLMGPITSTGEILVTGSVNLPPSLGATGSHPRLYDRSEVDYLFEAADREDAAAEAAPVRASRAVSTHTPTDGTLVVRKAYSNRLLTVLSVVAAVMAIGVAGLFAVGIAFNIF